MRRVCLARVPRNPTLPKTAHQLNEVADEFREFPCLTLAQLLKEVNIEISAVERAQSQMATALEYARQPPLMLPFMLVDLSYGQRSIHEAIHLTFINLDHPNSAHVLAKMLCSCSNRYNALQTRGDEKDDDDECMEIEDAHDHEGKEVQQQNAGGPKLESQPGLVDIILQYVRSRGQLSVQDHMRVRDTVETFGAPLNDIVRACRKHGFNVSRSGVYNVFMPPRKNASASSCQSILPIRPTLAVATE